MTSRDRMVIVVIAIAGLLAGFWFLVLGPKRSESSKLDGQISTQRQALAQADQSVAASEAARASYARNYTTVARLGKAVPANEDVPALVYQLESVAKHTAVDVRSIKLSPATAAVPAAVTASAASAATADPKSQPASPAATGASGPTGPTGASGPGGSVPAALPPGVSVGPGGFPTMPFSFEFEGSFFDLSRFAGRVDRLVTSRPTGLSVAGRLFTIDGIALNSAARGFPHMTATVAANAFVLPPEQGLTAGATPAAPAPGSSQTAGASGATSALAPATVGVAK